MLSSRIDANANETQIDSARKFGFLMEKGHFYGCSKNKDPKTQWLKTQKQRPLNDLDTGSHTL